MEGKIESPSFYPTRDEFEHLDSYVEQLEKLPAVRLAGVAKVIPPANFFDGHGPTTYKDGVTNVPAMAVKTMTFEKIQSEKGAAYRVIYGSTKTQSLFQYKQYNRKIFSGLESDEEFMKYFWETSLKGHANYASDVNVSFFREKLPIWNLGNLNSRLRYLGAKYQEAAGIYTSYSYFGSSFSPFVFHVEDKNLHSINYHHFGGEKIWIAIPPQQSIEFEQLVCDIVPGYECPNEIQSRRNILIPPETLEANGIDFSITIQRQSDFVITFPNTYHSGVNKSFNLCTYVRTEVFQLLTSISSI